ncbi:MAG TPA: N-acetylmuramoyl-L-alanine amidase [Acidobacteria bacterium]|nr:N-acetylmuramoyl-L-alanine amidase [Acidobacteriota bacterium]
MKRLIPLALVVGLFLSCPPLAAQTGTVSFHYAGRVVQVPRIGKRVELVPVFSLLGAEAKFSPSMGTWGVELNGHTVQFAPDRKVVLADGKLAETREAPVISPGGVAASAGFLDRRLLSPLGFHLEAVADGYRVVPGGRLGAPLSVRATAADFSTTTTLVLTLGREVAATVEEQEPGTVVVTLPDAAPQLDRSVVLRSQRISSLQPADGKLLVFLKPETGLLSWHVLSGPPRVILELGHKVAAPPAEASSPAPVARKEVRPIVIDPGHGGKDTGAISGTGLEEKNLTLAVARRLAKTLRGMGFAVRLTRTDDETRALTDRTALANRLDALAFVSLHANASRASSVRGAETYYMSLDAASDENAAAIAKLENAAGGKGHQGSELDMILWDMAQADVLNESAQLALSIQHQLNSLLGLPDRGVKQAPFVVLTGATMPAALVEVGFLSNPDEARRLADPAYQDRLARALATGIAGFLRSGR